jgi:hypothetical protein
VGVLLVPAGSGVRLGYFGVRHGNGAGDNRAAKKRKGVGWQENFSDRRLNITCIPAALRIDTVVSSRGCTKEADRLPSHHQKLEDTLANNRLGPT